MQGIILAAGSGRRLAYREGRNPKCLLEVGGRPLIQHQLDALARVGVESVVVVVGFEQEKIRQAVGSAATFVVNERYADTNSLYSFSLARDWVHGETFVLNGDVLFHPGILRLLQWTGGSALAYDAKSGDEAEHMKVAIHDGRLVEMSKRLPMARSDGENLEILRLGRQAARDAFAVAESLVARGRVRDWLATAINETARSHRFSAIDVDDLPWTEIDFAEDLERAA